MTINLTADEISLLKQLYFDGAWTVAEAHEHLGEERTDELSKAIFLHIVPTQIGSMYYLAAFGRKAAFGYLNDPRSVNSQMDAAYLRLCLADYGWPILPTDDFDLTQYDKSNRGRQVQTPQGKAIVFGQLTKPFSYQGLQYITDRFRPLALRYGFRIIVFTPSRVRGQKFAERHADILDLIHHLPNEDDELQAPSRLHVVTADTGFTTPHVGPATNPYESDKLRARGVGEETLSIFALPLKERIERAMSDLEVDGVISYGQLLRYYRLDAGDLVGVPFTRDLIQPVHTLKSFEEQVVFFCASKKLARRTGPILAHRAGTGELRRLLGAPADHNWQVEKRNVHQSEEPDAYWSGPQGLTAVEYDTGTYTATTIRFKMDKFRERGATQIIWGVPAPKRKANLETKFNLDVRLCRWWETE